MHTLIPGSSPVWCTQRHSFGTSSLSGLQQRTSWCSQVLQRQTGCRWQPPLQENLQPVWSGTAATGPTLFGGLGEHLANELQPQQVHHHPNFIKRLLKKGMLPTTYHLHGQQLVVVSSSKYLGVTVTDDLLSGNHAEKVAAKGNRTVGFLLRNFRHCTTKVRSAICITMVRPTAASTACSQLPQPHAHKPSSM